MRATKLLMLCVAAACCACLTVSIGVDASDEKVFRIGAVLESTDIVLEIALRRAIEVANGVLNRSKNLYGYRLVPDVRRISKSDGFNASLEACSLLETGVVAIVGPTSGQASEQVRSVCEYFAVPHIETNWNYRVPRPAHYTVNLSPHFDTYSRALNDYIETMVPTTRTAVIYDDPDSLLKFEGLLNSVEAPVLVRQWAERSGTYKYVMKELRAARISRFLVDIPLKKLVRFMIIAKEMNLTSEYNSYIFTSWDVNRVDLSDFQIIRGSNFSTLSLLPTVPPDATYNRGPIVEQMRQEIYRTELDKRDYSSLLSNMIPTAAATLFDSIVLLASGINQLSRVQQIRPQRLSCNAARQEMWTDGPSLLNFMRSMPSDIAQQTITGPISFDSDWKRMNFSLYAYELTANGFSEIGKWSSLTGYNVTKRFEDTQEEYVKTLQNRTLRVTTVADAPFVKIKETDENGVPLPHPSAWDGFCIDMLNLIAQQVGFNYTVHLVKDGKYGAVNGSDENGRETWNGMIGELINHEADLAIAPLTITYERERVIDFTTPYMSLGLSILFKRPEKSKPHLFSFLQPLSVPVWGYMLAAYVIVSFVLFVVARVSPYEWQNPHPCSPDNDEEENQFSLLNSLWFNAGSLMQQGSEISPRALSTRLISGIWWFFTLIMISSYTANLAAFLTVERMQSPIESAEDLAKQTKIKYGTLFGGSTYQFFKRAKIEVFRKMWAYMSKRPEVFVNQTGAGIARVKEGGYAFILESTMNEYYTERNCDLMRVGGLLDSKGYGIGLPTGSPYRDALSEAILKFQKEQDLENLRRKWWREMDIQTRCEDVAPDNQGPAGLGIDQVAGVYVVLAIGTAVGVLVMALEFCFKFVKRADEDRQPLTTEFIQELKFAMSCFGSSTRPANHLAQRAREVRNRAGNDRERQAMRLALSVDDSIDDGGVFPPPKQLDGAAAASANAGEMRLSVKPFESERNGGGGRRRQGAGEFDPTPPSTKRLLQKPQQQQPVQQLPAPPPLIPQQQSFDYVGGGPQQFAMASGSPPTMQVRMTGPRRAGSGYREQFLS